MVPKSWPVFHASWFYIYQKDDSVYSCFSVLFGAGPQRNAEQLAEEERLWAQQMRERRLKEEKRHSERQEALEKERRELNRLEEERVREPGLWGPFLTGSPWDSLIQGLTCGKGS